MPTNTNFPDDMRDLLIRLDTHVEKGFESVNGKLDALAKRADDQEERLRKLEHITHERTSLVARFLVTESKATDNEKRLQRLEGIEAKVSAHDTKFSELEGMVKISTPVLSKLWWPFIVLLAGAALGVAGTNAVDAKADATPTHQTTTH